MEYHTIGQDSIAEKRAARVPKQQVVKQNVVIRKRGLGFRIIDSLFGDEGLPSIIRSVGKEVLLPAILRGFVESMHSGINRAFNVESGRSYTSRPNNSVVTVGKFDYTGSYKARPRERSIYQVPDYIIKTKEEVLDILNGLISESEKYQYSRVCDYYDLIGVEPQTQADADAAYSHGWSHEDLVHTTYSAVSDGYVINFPRPVTYI